LLQYPDFEFINHDVNKPIALEQFDELDKFKVKFQGIQEVYHLACPTSPKDFEKQKVESLVANSVAMLNTLDLAVRYRAKYVFSSSAVVYGTDVDAKKTLTETDQGIANHLSERACYDEGKRFAETCVSTYKQVYGIDAKIARVFTTYGPHMRLFEKQLIPDFIMNALEGKDLVIYGDESFSTSLCYVTDMVDGLVRLMVNIGGDTTIKYADVAQMILSLTNSTSRLVFKEKLLFLTGKTAPNLAYAKEALGWLPLVRLEDGLRKTIDYVIAHKESLLFSHN
jgi:UDP-glucuronate decarboxylase